MKRTNLYLIKIKICHKTLIRDVQYCRPYSFNIKKQQLVYKNSKNADFKSLDLKY